MNHTSIMNLSQLHPKLLTMMITNKIQQRELEKNKNSKNHDHL